MSLSRPSTCPTPSRTMNTWKNYPYPSPAAATKTRSTSGMFIFCTPQDVVKATHHQSTTSLITSTTLLSSLLTNAHHLLWHTETTQETWGHLVADWIDNSDLAILNENLLTRVTENSSTALDISIASASVLTSCPQLRPPPFSHPTVLRNHTNPCPKQNLYKLQKSKLDKLQQKY